VTGTGIDKDVAAVVTYSGNDSYGSYPPATPIVAPVVYLPPTGFSTMPSANLTNKIGAIEYNIPNTADANAAAWCVQTNGGLAAIVINQPGYGLPFVGDGSTFPVTIPVLVVNGRSADGGSGDLDFWRTNTDLVANIGADTHLMLGQADYGKGMSDVDFDFVVPAPGAYPLRLFYFQGNGGAGCEWSTVTPNVLSVSAATGRVLLNDYTTPNSFKTYRALLPNVRPVFTSQATANGSLTITWQGAGILQSSPQLGAAADWTDVWPQPGTASYTIPAAAGNAFYRLRLPDVPTP